MFLAFILCKSALAELMIPLEPLSVDVLTDTVLKNNYNEYYTGNIYIGSPTQVFPVIFDIGSSYIWIPGVDCIGCPSGSIVYDQKGSTTFHSLDKQITISYLTKNVTGTLATENIAIGDVKKIVATSQTFVVVSKEAGFENLNAAGIVGLGISNPEQTSTLIETLKAEGKISKSTFSLFLNNNKYEHDDRRKPKSMLIIGGYDLDTYSNGDSVKYYNVVNNTGLWSIKLDKITCKDTEIDLDAEYVVLDSRHSKIVGPKKTIKKLFDRFEAMYGCGYYYSRMVCDCSEIYTIVKFPSITFEIDGDSYTMTENDYFKKTSKTCYLMFESADIDYWIFGQPFLRNYYSIYDYDNQTVGLVKATSSRFTVDTDSNWWIIPVILIVGGAVWLFSWLAWTYYKRYGTDSKLLIEEEARG